VASIASTLTTIQRPSLVIAVQVATTYLGEGHH